MATDLRAELTRLADDAPPLHLDPTAWSRGRRARRRDRAVTGVATLALVTSLGGAGLALVLDPSTPETAGPAAPTTSDRAEGVPELLVLPPTRLVETGDGPARWDTRVATDDLAVGRGAAAFEVPGVDPDGDAVPMLVAADGRHLALALPGWQGTPEGADDFGPTRVLALSPDGSRLAWAWDDAAGSGLRVADLGTGEVSDLPFPDGVADVVGQVSWSPDAARVEWCGALVEAGADGGRGSGLVCGVADAASGRVRTVPVDDRVAGAPRPATVSSTSPDGSTVLLGSTDATQSARFLDVVSDEVVERPLGQGLDLYPEGAEVHPLGWVDDSLAVALVTPAGDTVTPDDEQVVVMSAPSVPEESRTYRVVGHVDTRESSAFGPGSLSVATDLMTLDRPTVATEEPAWPSDGGWWRTGAWLLLLFAAWGGGCLLLRHRAAPRL